MHIVNTTGGAVLKMVVIVAMLHIYKDLRSSVLRRQIGGMNGRKRVVRLGV